MDSHLTGGLHSVVDVKAKDYCAKRASRLSTFKFNETYCACVLRNQFGSSLTWLRFFIRLSDKKTAHQEAASKKSVFSLTEIG